MMLTQTLHRFVDEINFIAPSKIIRAKANSKPWFDNQIVSTRQRRDELYKKFKHPGLETGNDNFKVAKMHLPKMILKKKKYSFEEELGKNRNKTKGTLEDFKVTQSKLGQSKTIKNFS